MRITVNGEVREVETGVTVRALIELLGFGDRQVAIERNRDVVPRADHATTLLSENDVIEVVQFVGGG